MLAKATNQFLARPQTASFLGLTSSRYTFSTIQPKVFSNAVFMAELYPARLTIPTSKEGVSYDFTCDNS